MLKYNIVSHPPKANGVAAPSSQGATSAPANDSAMAFEATLSAPPNSPRSAAMMTTDATTGASRQAEREREREAEEQREREERRRSLRFAMLIFLGVWPAFFLLDILMCHVILPAARNSLMWIALWRTVGEVSVLMWMPLLRRPGISARWLKAGEILGTSFPVICVALISLPLGGPLAIYQHGVSLMLLVRLALLPAPWRSILPMTILHVCLYPAVMLIAATVDAKTALSFRNVSNIGTFAANYIFVVLSAGIGVFVSNSAWMLRRQIFEARKLGRYRLKAPIGSGGMGEVWLAWDQVLRRDVALKLLRGGANGAAEIRRFEREARAAGRLRSPYTIQIYDFGASDDGLWYMAMELLVGADLRKLVETTGPLSEARAVHFARQACLSLAEAHEAGVIHRDVKPGNIFIGRSGEFRDCVKLLDFGIAKLTDGAEGDTTATQTNFVGGTPTYMAPEVCAGRPADARSDLYSLGATLYFMLAGRPPHIGASIGELLIAHMTFEPEFPSKHRGTPITTQLEAIVMRCLKKSPDERFASARELHDALSALTCADRWDDSDAQRFWAVTFP